MTNETAMAVMVIVWTAAATAAIVLAHARVRRLWLEHQRAVDALREARALVALAAHMPEVHQDKARAICRQYCTQHGISVQVDMQDYDAPTARPEVRH